MANLGSLSPPEVSAAGGDNGGAPRAVLRRRSLPGGRAVAGGLLVAAAAVGLFAAANRAAAKPHHPYVVARSRVEPGTRLQASDLARRRLDLPPSIRSRAFDDPSVLVGAVAIAPLAPGELVQASAVVARPAAGTREVSFPVERGHLPLGIKDGERLDVIATYGSGDEAVSTVVVRQAQVVGVERSRGSLGESGAVVTVALDQPGDVVALAHALRLGKITLARATGASPAPAAAEPYRPPASRTPPAPARSGP